ncbi:methyltransferase family protein [Mangrovivirga halotolerans]|uniref:methyltransferase family protein n=1 Tax=Mangrovivirga halotolerans TaxID=2993936 RepID=UPI0034E237C8
MVFIVVLNWLMFYFLHSFLADTQIKEKTRKLTGLSKRQYRLTYTIFSTFHFLALIGIYYLLPKEEFIHLPYSKIVFIITLIFGTIIIVSSFHIISIKEFTGLEKQNDPPQLIKSGIYKYIRHPIYTGTILIILGWLYSSLNLYSLIIVVISFLYLPIGIWLEERKLIKEFGDNYILYKNYVGGIIPKYKSRN